MPDAALFQPIRIKRVSVRNRIAMAPMSTQYANADGSVTPRMVRYYEERARGGTGLVIVEFAYIDDIASRAEWAQLACHTDTLLPGLSELAERIKLHGAAACLQIAHAGAQKLHDNPPFVAPSAIPWNEHSPVPRELTIAEIEAIQDAFAAAAQRVKRAGFDMVELHAAHGYLLTEFLSETSNKRSDKYGGSRDNRQRFILELLEKVQRRVGADYPVGIRLSAEDYSGGFTLDDTLVLCRKLAAAGIAYIHVSSGTYANRETRITPTYFYPLGNYVPLAEAIKKTVTVPVIASGSILDPEMAEDVVASGRADMVAMARQLFADAHWANKVQRGELDEIVRCIRCNEGCLLRIIEGKQVRCWVNPATGNEAEFELRPAAPRRRVMVIGGGPGGLQAARTAAERGHDVALFDEGEQLGGQLIPAATPWFKQDLVPLTSYLVRQVDKFGVEVHRGTRVNPDLIRKYDPDVVFLATGARPIWPDVRRSRRTPQLVSAHDVITGKVQTGNYVIVVGGGLIGAETAWFLAEQGKQVTVTTRQQIVGHDLLPTARIVLADAYRKNGVRSINNVKLDEITEKGAVFIDRGWERQQLETETLVLASGMTSCTELADDPALAGRDLHVIGDARQPSNIGSAILAGAYLARLI